MPNAHVLADDLNFLLAIETHGLLRHLEKASPYLTPQMYPVWADIRRIAASSANHAHELTDLLASLDIPERPSGFPFDVANYHYVKLEMLMPLLVEEKRQQVQAYERALKDAADAPHAREVLEGLLDENRSQLEKLEQYASEHAEHAIA